MKTEDFAMGYVIILIVAIILKLIGVLDIGWIGCVLLPLGVYILIVAILLFTLFILSGIMHILLGLKNICSYFKKEKK